MINKVVYGQTTLLDLTNDTVNAANLDSGYTAHDANGAPIVGTSTKDADTSDATATAVDILSGQTAYANGSKLTGTMANRGAASGTISVKDDVYSIQQGYHNGSGSVSIASAEQNKIVAENIRTGISILGITGSYEGSGSGDTSDATATAADILSGQTAYISSGKTTGTMANNGAVYGVISAKAESYTVPVGYHNGSGTVSIASAEQDKIIPGNIKDGITILGVTGSLTTDGTDTSDATATAADILSGQTAYADGEKLTGTMLNRGGVSGLIKTKTDTYTVTEGYHDGSGTVSIDSAEQAKIIASNIKSGVSILGVTGTIRAAAVEPYVEEFNKGWVGNGVWTYQNPTDTFVDIYRVIAGHEYWLTLGANVGTRFRAMFTTVDVTTITSGKITGTNVNNADNPAPFANFSYTPSSNGYLVIGKDNIGKTGIKTYLYDKTASWL